MGLLFLYKRSTAHVLTRRLSAFTGLHDDGHFLAADLPGIALFSYIEARQPDHVQQMVRRWGDREAKTYSCLLLIPFIHFALARPAAGPLSETAVL